MKQNQQREKKDGTKSRRHKTQASKETFLVFPVETTGHNEL